MGMSWRYDGGIEPCIEPCIEHGGIDPSGASDLGAGEGMNTESTGAAIDAPRVEERPRLGSIEG